MKAEVGKETANRQRLFDIARAYTEKKGWPWLEPVGITEVVSFPQIRIWEIRTNLEAHGGNVRIMVAEKELEVSVVESGYIPR